MIVVDASAAVAALLNAGPARQALAIDQLHAPHLIDSEVASALRRTEADGRISASSAELALKTWRSFGLIRHPIVGLLGRVWELRANLTAYDATYVAVAEALDCSLITCDRRLAQAPRLRCPVTVVSG